MGNAKQEAELRTQSFNGMIRYWYRLLGGSKETEDRIFGTASQKKAQKGKVSIKLRINEFEKYLDNQGRPIHWSGINYLGFYLHHKPKDEPEVKRQYIDVQQYFSLIFSFHQTLTDYEIKQFLCAFWCSLYLGNFGSRSRRGFGSIICTQEPNISFANFNLSFKVIAPLAKKFELLEWKRRYTICIPKS